MRIANVLEQKNQAGQAPLITAKPDDTVLAAIRSLCENRIGSLVVLDADGRLCGIVTEHDVLGQCCRDHKACDMVTIDTLMTRDVITATPRESLEDALQTMTRREVRHLPVVEGDATVGILSIGDILRWLYRQDELKIRHLSDYLGGTYGLKVY